MEKVFTTQKRLAEKLGVSVYTVQNWIQRGKIESKIDELTGMRLVEIIDIKPTMTYQKKVSK